MKINWFLGQEISLEISKAYSHGRHFSTKPDVDLNTAKMNLRMLK